MQPSRRQQVNKRGHRWAVLLLSLCFLSVIPPAMGADSKITRFDRSGIIVYSLHNEGSPDYTVTAVLRAGSILDESGLGGTAEATLLMVRDSLHYHFQNSALGTIPIQARLTEFSASLELRVPVEVIEPGLRLLAEGLQSPILSTAALDQAVSEIQSQYLQVVDGVPMLPWRVLESRLKRGVEGYMSTPDSVALLTVADIRAFHERYYVPNNLWLAVSSPESALQVDEHISQAFSSWSRQNVSFTHRSGTHNPIGGWQRVVFPDSPSVYVAIGGLSGGRWSPERHDLAILLQLLTQSFAKVGLDARLQLHEGEPGLWWMWIETSKEEAPTTWYTVQQVCGKLQAGAFSETQVIEGRQAVLARRSLEVRSAGDRVAQYAFNEVTGYPGAQGISDVKQIKRVRSRDVRTLARRVLSPENLVGVVVLNAETSISASKTQE